MLLRFGTFLDLDFLLLDRAYGPGPACHMCFPKVLQRGAIRNLRVAHQDLIISRVVRYTPELVYFAI